MTSVLASAFAQGFTADQVIQYLVRHSPQYARQIASASGVGYTPKQILRYLTKDNPKERAAATEYEETRTRDNTNRTNANKAVIGGALAATGLPLAASAASSALSRALPQSLQNNIPQIANAMGSGGSNQGTTPQQPTTGTLQQPSNQIPSQQPPISANVPNTQQGSQQPPLNNPIAASIPEPANINQSKGFDTNIIKNGLAYKGQIDALIKSGNGPEEIEAYLKKFSPQAVKTIEKEGKGAFKDVVGQYIQEKTQEDALQPEGSLPNDQAEPIQPQLQEAQQLQEPIEQPEVKAEAPKIEKNSVVSSPEGLGTVREIRNGKALVEIDGKLTKVNEEDLEPPLYSDDEIADAYDNLMAKIPEKERSGFISWAGYDENTNELGFIPRGGKYEVITDISPEEAKMIKEGTGTARTNGEVREGLWVAGGETRGGVISQIIHDRRRKREAEEKKQGKFSFDIPKPEKQDRGMKPQFDEMAYARNLSRVREKKAKDEERARKKKEKDEAKKRKK